MLIILWPAAASTADRELAAARPDQGESCTVVPDRKSPGPRIGRSRLLLTSNGRPHP